MFSVDPTVRELIEFQVTGLCVVLTTLSFLAICCSCIGRIFKSLALRKAQHDALSSDEKVQADHTIVVIAAAVAQTLQKPHKIVQVRSLTSGNKGWPLEGRSRHHVSHKLR